MMDVTKPLAIKNVSKSYASFRLARQRPWAVANLNCQFLQGHCTGILGHNGAGKTTTLRLLLGLINPDKGEILYGGKTLRATDVRFGYMPEVSSLPSQLTPDEVLSSQLKAFSRFDRKTRSRVRIKSLRSMGLWTYRKQKIRYLSKGLERRLSWLLATAHDPDVIILDEPFVGLDPFIKVSIFEQIKQLKNEGKTVILCAHEFHHIQELCDDIYVLKQGKLLSLDLKSQALQTNEFNLPGIKYTLSVSGTNAAELQKIADKHNLKSWDSLDNENYLCVLKFSEYTLAAEWLRACLEMGLIVLRFNNDINLQDKTVRNMFVAEGEIVQDD